MFHIGLDSETHRGRAVLVCTPKLWNIRPASFGELMEWLSLIGTSFVCYNMDFDASAFLRVYRGKKRKELFRLLGLTNRATIDGWDIHYVPSKYFKARRIKGKDERRFAIYDMAQFFHTSLDKAAKKIGQTGKKMDPRLEPFIKSGRMGDALDDPVLRKLMIEYCCEDANQVELIAGYLAASFERIKLSFERPVSPAGLARTFWGSKMAGSFSIEDEKFARSSYHGGRIEVLSRGMIPNVYEYDIHSAYPSIMARLFRPGVCGRIEGEPLRNDAVYAIAEVTVRLRQGFDAYPLPIVAEGNVIVYPWGDFRVRVDLHTLRMLETLGGTFLDKFEVTRLIQWTPTKDDRPFARMADMFLQRKNDPPADMALKLVLNGSYGLLAETAGVWTDAVDFRDAWYAGDRYWRRVELRGSGRSFVLASHITGAIRSKLFLETLGHGPVSYMTDGAFTREPIKQSLISPALGDWGEKGKADVLIVGSGMYAVQRNGKWETKSRGWTGLGELPTLLEKAGQRSYLDLQELRAKSLRECARDAKARFTVMNDLRHVPRVLDLNFDRKRQWPGRARARDLLAGEIESFARGVLNW